MFKFLIEGGNLHRQLSEDSTLPIDDQDQLPSPASNKALSTCSCQSQLSVLKGLVLHRSNVSSLMLRIKLDDINALPLFTSVFSCGPVVRALALRSGYPGFKTGSDH